MPLGISGSLYLVVTTVNEFPRELVVLAGSRADRTVSLGRGVQQCDGSASVVLTLLNMIIFSAAEPLLTEGLTAGADQG
jgi:multiple sugar transport system permease protein